MPPTALTYSLTLRRCLTPDSGGMTVCGLGASTINSKLLALNLTVPPPKSLIFNEFRFLCEYLIARFSLLARLERAFTCISNIINYKTLSL